MNSSFVARLIAVIVVLITTIGGVIYFRASLKEGIQAVAVVLVGLFFLADEIQADPTSWRSTEKMVGVPDLEGAQMFVRVKSHVRLDDPVANRELRELQKAGEITSTMILHLNGGRSCYVDMMQRFESTNGDPVYVFVFPQGEDFTRLVR